jgi:signal transduction histidine kinase
MKSSPRYQNDFQLKRWRSSTFRLIVLSTSFTAIAISTLLGVLAYTVSSSMMRQVDSELSWQLIYFDSLSSAELPVIIRDRSRYGQLHVNSYGLFDANGKLLAGAVTAFPPSLRVNREGLTLLHPPQIEGAPQARVVRAMAVKRDNGETLLIARDLSNVIQTRDDMVRSLFAGGGLVLVVGIGSGFLLTLRQARRLKAIRHATLRIAEGDLGQRLPTAGGDEVEMLAHLVNRMMDEVERLMHEVKGACDGIAHDLRTPLLHVRTLLNQINADKKLFGDSRSELRFDQARNEVESLLERFHALLRISEISTLNRHRGFEELALDQLVSELGELFASLAESRGIEMIVTVTTPMSVRGDRNLLFEAISNLLDNALKFTPEHGEVTFQLSAGSLGPQIDVIDTGPGILPEERKAVLQRFYRSAQTSHFPGSGLGLSVVSAVVKLHDFGLQISDTVARDNLTPHALSGTRVSIQCWPQSIA